MEQKQLVKLKSSPDERGGKCADRTNVPILRVSTQQKSFHSSHLSTGEIWAVLELFQDGWVRVHNVGCIQGAAHVSQHCHGISSQTRCGYTLKENNGSQYSVRKSVSGWDKDSSDSWPGTHQAALGIREKSASFVAQGRGEHGKICISQLCEISSAEALWHQGVTADTQRYKNNQDGLQGHNEEQIFPCQRPQKNIFQLTHNRAIGHEDKGQSWWRLTLCWCSCTWRSAVKDRLRVSEVNSRIRCSFWAEFLVSYLSLHQWDLVLAFPPAGFDQLFDLRPLQCAHAEARKPLQHGWWQAVSKDTHNKLYLLGKGASGGYSRLASSKLTYLHLPVLWSHFLLLLH